MNRENITKILKVILFISVISFIAVFWYIIFNPDNIKESTVRNLLYMSGKFAGLIGFLFLSFLIFSGETARYFDRFFGINKIILFQRKFSLITCLFVVMHPVFFILANKSFSYLIPSFTFTPFSIGILSFYLFIIIMVSSVLYKKISYIIWQYLHIIIYVLFFFSLYHAVNIGSDSGQLPIRLLYLIAFVSISVGMIYRTYYKIKQRTQKKFYLKNIKWETKDTYTLTLESKKNIMFKAGQFFFIRLKRKGIYARHPISASSSPNEENLKFTIKLKGRFTKVASNLNIGEEIIVEGPFGIFTIEDTIGRDKNKNLVFIAGGVGITPFLSIIKSPSMSSGKRDITLFYFSKTIYDIIFKSGLDNIREDWLKKIYVVSEDEPSGNVEEKGMINKDLITKYLDKEKIKNSVFYICGPEKMKDCAIKELKELGVKKENIIIEDFFW